MSVAAIKISLPHKTRSTQRTRPEDLRVLLERSAELPSTRVHAESQRGPESIATLGPAERGARCHGDAASLAPTAAMLSLEPKCGTRNLLNP